MVRSQAGLSSVVASFIEGSPVPAGRLRAPNRVRSFGTSSPERTRVVIVSNTASSTCPEAKLRLREYSTWYTE
jgi:hypothetical protein